MYNPNNYGMSDLARRRAFEQRHVSADVEPMGNPRRDNRLGLAIWLIVGVISATLILFAMWGMG